jgi:hypothetical protein
MKARLQTIVLAVSWCLAGFIACYSLMWQPQAHRKPSVMANAPFPAAGAVLNLPPVSTQKFHIDGGIWYQWPDGTVQWSPTPEMRPGYYDLIDTRAQPRADLIDVK